MHRVARVPGSSLQNVRFGGKRIVSRFQHGDTQKLAAIQTSVAEKLVPWMDEMMPNSYFRQMDEETRFGQYRTLSAYFDPTTGQFRSDASRITHDSVTSSGQKELTFVEFGASSHEVFLDQVHSLVSEHPVLDRMKGFSSKDGNVSFNVYTFLDEDESPASLKPCSPEEQAAYDQVSAEILDFAKHVKECHQNGKPFPEGIDKWSEYFEPEPLMELMKECTPKHVIFSRPRSFLQQCRLYNEVRGTDRVAVYIDQEKDDEERVPGGSSAPRHAWVRIAERNVVPQVGLHRILRLLNEQDIRVLRMHVNLVPHLEGQHGITSTTTMFRLLVENNDPARWQEVERMIKRLKFIDDATLDMAFRKTGTKADSPKVGLIRAEVITSLKALCHPILASQNAFTYSKSNIRQVLDSVTNLKLATDIADAFIRKFDPKNGMTPEEHSSMIASLHRRIEGAVLHDAVASAVLHKMVDQVDATLRTNLYLEDRYALSSRLDPRIMRPVDSSQAQLAWNSPQLDMASPWEVPYGVFFSHGRRFNGFHVRNRDIARGGLRLVSPRSESEHAMECGKHFSEAYALAFGQQLKNKDIPEGGAKGVVLIDTFAHERHSLTEKDLKNSILRKSLQYYTDSLLDLIVDETKGSIQDYYGKPELLYFGPDEQVIPSDIDWIIKRAAERGYPLPSACMSSKPLTGINHKVYGVTSEGVQVFLDEALKFVDLHPLDPKRTEPVTIKITGGPGGDVAGNMLRLLDQHYGDKVQVLGIIDGTGCVEDPNGIDMGELLRLFHAGLDLDQFDTSRLSGAGELHLSNSPEGALRASSMHNRLVTDVFIPGGGRPNTIDEGNWKDFLQANGEPSSKIIVEGANVFLTSGARQALFDHCNLPIVKDSSANKCGVICSSYEIMCSMLLTDKEFLDNKEAIVNDVLVRLRELARREARLMLQEFKTRPGSLVHFSEIISRAINRLTDAIALRLDDTQLHMDTNNPQIQELIRSHLPPKVNELAGDRIYSKVPAEYIKRLVSSALACRIVYDQGVLYVEEHPDSKRLGDLAFEYLDNEDQIETIVSGIQGHWHGDDELKQKAIRIIKEGGIRVLQK